MGDAEKLWDMTMQMVKKLGLNYQDLVEYFANALISTLVIMELTDEQYMEFIVALNSQYMKAQKLHEQIQRDDVGDSSGSQD